MKKKQPRIWLQLAIPIVITVGIKVFSLYGGLVEQVYTNTIYPALSTLLRAITGWLPISLGDILYTAVVIWLIVGMFVLAKTIIRRKSNWPGFWQGLAKTVARALWVYIFFYGFWALNYSRFGISYQLQLKPNRYTTAELMHLTELLIKKVNEKRGTLGNSSFVYPPNTAIFRLAANGYDSAARQYPFLKYQCKSIKPSLFGTLNNYLGFLGYYNPFTGEAQVNTHVPPFIVPYTACHEIAHQVGYGSESEANFVGYLAAKASNNNILQYSTYADLFSYANGELFVRDSAAARSNFRALDTLVKQDYRNYRKFVVRYKNPVEPILRLFYSQYLKANNQPKGIETYEEVVAWLIAFEKKQGEI